jgi:hypothetical protein
MEVVRAGWRHILKRFVARKIHLLTEIQIGFVQKSIYSGLKASRTKFRKNKVLLRFLLVQIDTQRISNLEKEVISYKSWKVDVETLNIFVHTSNSMGMHPKFSTQRLLLEIPTLIHWPKLVFQVDKNKI